MQLTVLGKRLGAGVLLLAGASIGLVAATELDSTENDEADFPAGAFIQAPVEGGYSKKIQGMVDFEKVRLISKSSQDYKLARKIGMVSIRLERGSSSCSGFLINNDYFMTNHHCIYFDGKVQPASAFSIYMDYLHDRKPGSISARVSEIVDYDERLDYAVFKLDRPLGKKRGFLSLEPKLRFESGDAVKVIQHPMGRSKEISRKSSKVNRNYKDVLHYQADTEGGSSGSPVFMKGGTTVVALHHVGSENYNEGVKISMIYPRILKFLPKPKVAVKPPKPPKPVIPKPPKPDKKKCDKTNKCLNWDLLDES